VIKHPNILPFAAASNAPPHAACFDGVVSCTLSQRLQAGDLDATTKSVILCEIARALEWLHSLNITHRNLSPDVVFLTSDRHVRLGGLYIAGSSARDAERLTPMSAYLSPELLSNPNCFNPAVDVYAFTVIAWQFITGRVPFEGVPPSRISMNVLFRDARPVIPRTLQPASFFFRGWSRNPDCRPAFADIVHLIQSKQLVVPETDLDALEAILGNAAGPAKSAFSSALTASIEAVVAKAGDLSDSDIALLARAFREGDEEMQANAGASLERQLNRTSALSPVALCHFLKVSMTMPAIVQQLCELVRQLPRLVDFANLLADSIPPDYFVSFFAQVGINSDELATVLLAWGQKQLSDVARKLVDVVIRARPDSLILFDFVKPNTIYYDRGLSLLQSFSSERLVANWQLIVRFVDNAPGQAVGSISGLMERLRPLVPDGIDDECAVFAQLVIWGCCDTVLAYAELRIYCQRFVKLLIPRFAVSHQVFVLKLSLMALRFKELVPLLLGFDLIDMVAACIQAREFDIMAQILLAVPFPPELFVQKRHIADFIAAKLDETQSTAERSVLCLALLHFSLRGNWIPTRKVVQIVANVMQSDDTTEVTRAMTLAAALAQTREIARLLAEVQNLEVLVRFFHCGAPDHIVYVAARLFVAIAPFLKLEGLADVTVQEALKDSVDLVLESAKHPKIVLVMTQAFVLLPHGDRWEGLFNDCNVMRLVEFAKATFPGDAGISEMTRLLEGRCGKS
jgi:serine/threonine protein kinase